MFEETDTYQQLRYENGTSLQVPYFLILPPHPSVWSPGPLLPAQATCLCPSISPGPRRRIKGKIDLHQPTETRELIQVPSSSQPYAVLEQGGAQECHTESCFFALPSHPASLTRRRLRESFTPRRFLVSVRLSVFGDSHLCFG